ncbi:MAG: HD domain-containing protein [Deltaproteobacteria bacterium]|nr:HD domain-containing protein [Deltaproteobacteria bacterium]
MRTEREITGKSYQGKALIADSIHQYIWFTVPIRGRITETTEKDLIDNPWVQRLRRIYQLQSARWVYPAAEHTRFQHSLGTMHVAGEFGRYLYPSLREIFPDIPSPAFVEELLRIGGLLHDIGHGPYCHFFDDNFLCDYGLNHELIGREIIRRELGEQLLEIRRSPSADFAPGERIDPEQVAFLILKSENEKAPEAPSWMNFLRQLFTGIYTVDNLDYVQRDAYVTGFSMDLVDVKRLLYYSFYSSDGLTLHQAGNSALSRFLNARMNLYTNVYFHRTTRALDLHLREIFRETMNILFPGNPLDDLAGYRTCDDWTLYNAVRQWHDTEDERKAFLGREWDSFHTRKIKWKMSFSSELFIEQIQRGFRFSTAEDYEREIRTALPSSLRDIIFRVDLAAQDPRPINPILERNKRITIFNPLTEKVSLEPLREIYRFIPARVVHFRVFALDHHHDGELARAAEKALGSIGEIITTNI